LLLAIVNLDISCMQNILQYIYQIFTGTISSNIAAKANPSHGRKNIASGASDNSGLGGTMSVSTTVQPQQQSEDITMNRPALFSSEIFFIFLQNLIDTGLKSKDKKSMSLASSLAIEVGKELASNRKLEPTFLHFLHQVYTSHSVASDLLRNNKEIDRLIMSLLINHIYQVDDLEIQRFLKDIIPVMIERISEEKMIEIWDSLVDMIFACWESLKQLVDSQSIPSGNAPSMGESIDITFIEKRVEQAILAFKAINLLMINSRLKSEFLQKNMSLLQELTSLIATHSQTFEIVHGSSELATLLKEFLSCVDMQ